MSALGLTVFILFSDFQDIYHGMEVRAIHYHIFNDSHVRWNHICTVNYYHILSDILIL